ncbi:MAG: hypothetical protein L6R41_006373 [Letrouitia leprolyta]|nr:MAG: hypothetical protein L6R41_006373 [Letrouitia leprolyta]
MGLAFEAEGPPTNIQSGLKPPRPSRPSFNKLHAQPLPIKAYPLPPLIPHNPLSLLQIAFTYLSQLISPPLSHPETPLRCYFSAETQSIHVTDEATARILWEQGFFGKGSLSRSEPAWLEREKIRQGLLVGNTSEELTRKRREERKQFKKERAKKEREAIEEKLAEEAGNDTVGVIDGVSEEVNGDIQASPSDDQSPPNAPSPPNTTLHSLEKQEILENPPEASKIIFNQEHLQLTLEEAFFLVYTLGVLEVLDPANSCSITTSKLFPICRSHSYFPSRSSNELAPDDPFLLSYVVYHHFRSLGWVVRPGIKFAVDYLLYNRGPVFSHAEFAVIIIPSYSHAYWSSTQELQASVRKKEKKSWWWLHCVNRVQAQVRKSLVVVYVEVPPPEDFEETTMNELGDVVDVSQFLKRYWVREFILKRWTPNRSRG